jgi:hypothetical protein
MNEWNPRTKRRGNKGEKTLSGNQEQVGVFNTKGRFVQPTKARSAPIKKADHK